jgi:hypothetical protein
MKQSIELFSALVLVSRDLILIKELEDLKEIQLFSNRFVWMRNCIFWCFGFADFGKIQWNHLNGKMLWKPQRPKKCFQKSKIYVAM